LQKQDFLDLNDDSKKCIDRIKIRNILPSFNPFLKNIMQSLKSDIMARGERIFKFLKGIQSVQVFVIYLINVA
jgi:hypothetical protein